MKSASLPTLLVTALALALATSASADRIELNDGSLINGKLVSAEAGKFKVETAFAGTIEIAQDKIRSFTTDEPVNVELAAGGTPIAMAQTTGANITVVSGNGQATAVTPGVSAVWRIGADSPAMRLAKETAEKARRKWAYESSVAIAGRTGASEKFGAAFGFKATLASAQDKLIFAAAAERAQDNGTKTAERQFGGVDYSSFYSGDNGWYVRTSLENDKIKALDLRSSSGVGFGRKLVKNARQDLELRLGASYLYETYSNNTKFSSPGLDLSFLNTFNFGSARLTNVLTYAPTFKDFANYRLHHESIIEVPLTAALWKLKLGVTNDYQNRQPAGVVRFDTTYFTSLILNWQ